MMGFCPSLWGQIAILALAITVLAFQMWWLLRRDRELMLGSADREIMERGGTDG